MVVSWNMKRFTDFRLGVGARLDSLFHSLLQFVLLVVLNFLLKVLWQVVDSGVGLVMSLFLNFGLSLVDLRELNLNFFGLSARHFQLEFVTFSS